MPRQRRASTVSSSAGGSTAATGEQELSSMYDYLAKIILLGPSGCGKSCLLHRFVKEEWRVLSSQTIGVEFASKIVKVGTGSRRRRVKLQLWDTAGTERFRSVSRSYYRGAAGAILVYDIASHASFRGLPTFLYDARALASPHLTLVLAGNKTDLAEDSASSGVGQHQQQRWQQAQAPTSGEANVNGDSIITTTTTGATTAPPSQPTTLGSRNSATVAPEGRDVSPAEAAAWAQSHDIATSVEVSALSGDGVDGLFETLASTILTRIELGEIDPDDPQSGIHYGDSGWSSRMADGNASVKSGQDGGMFGSRRRRKWGGGGAVGAGGGGLRDWEDVFTLDRRRRRGCC